MDVRKQDSFDFSCYCRIQAVTEFADLLSEGDFIAAARKCVADFYELYIEQKRTPCSGLAAKCGFTLIAYTAETRNPEDLLLIINDRFFIFEDNFYNHKLPTIETDILG